jgi:hypothetical protein
MSTASEAASQLLVAADLLIFSMHLCLRTKAILSAITTTDSKDYNKPFPTVCLRYYHGVSAWLRNILSAKQLKTYPGGNRFPFC